MYYIFRNIILFICLLAGAFSEANACSLDQPASTNTLSLGSSAVTIGPGTNKQQVFTYDSGYGTFASNPFSLSSCRGQGYFRIEANGKLLNLGVNQISPGVDVEFIINGLSYASTPAGQSSGIAISTIDYAKSTITGRTNISNVQLRLSLDQSKMASGSGSYDLSKLNFALGFTEAGTISDFIPIMNFTITGLINYGISSCSTPDVNYDLGKFDGGVINTASVSDWVPTPVTLTNCGTFQGTIAISNNSKVTTQPNNVNLSASLVTAAIPGVIGGFSIAKSNNSASGIGLQLGVKTGASTQYQQLPIGTRITNTIPLNSVSGGNIVFDLGVRLVKIQGQQVTPGVIDSSLVYTIDYN